ncbi:LiaF transmembrane domain-containing protein [Desertivirga xinjiangensis]|uniref:LiaF transmembrane domain-containing protein n=1 Tax=Desertivirga xinjiangensis TaxID=539206 RepID=UPI00210B6412|nr:DUF5668 domain-containing protein [Pedobacter xinjiangensis]
MKTERIIWGLIFLFIGGVLLLDNFDVINFHWHVIWRFWPVILIIVGANMIFSREDRVWAGSVSIIVTFLALVFIAYQGVQPQHSRDAWIGPDYHDDQVGEGKFRDNVFAETMSPGISRAELNIKGGATQYTLEDTTAELFQAEVRRHMGNYSLFRTSRDSVEVLNFNMTGKKKWESNKIRGNKAVLKLNTQPLWDVNLEVGAGKLNFDLSAFKIRNVSFEGGAASLKLKLGVPAATSTVRCETGVSEIEIMVPEAAACQIRLESGLSSNDFEGFTRQTDGTYITPNFNFASKKIIIDLEGGLSKFEVRRY